MGQAKNIVVPKRKKINSMHLICIFLLCIPHMEIHVDKKFYINTSSFFWPPLFVGSSLISELGYVRYGPLLLVAGSFWWYATSKPLLVARRLDILSICSTSVCKVQPDFFLLAVAASQAYFPSHPQPSRPISLVTPF